MSILRSISFVAGFAALIACRDNHHHTKGPAAPDLPIVRAALISFPPLADPECKSPPQGLMESTVSYQWSRGAVQRNIFHVRELEMSAAPISSAAVGEVLHDARFTRYCDTRLAAPPACSVEQAHEPTWTEVAHGQPLSACGLAAEPPRFSVESQALTLTAFVTRAATKLKAVMGGAVSPKKVTILASPRFSSFWSPWQEQGRDAIYEMLYADNLAYFAPSASTPPMIAALPTSHGPTASLYLWESYFVAAHEYGHHIEYSIGARRPGSRPGLMRTAVSEGFADVLAFVAEDLTDDSLRGIPCLGADRSVMAANFSGGITKSLTAAIIKRAESGHVSFLAEAAAQVTTIADATCQGTPPHSPHGLGAIFARALVELAKNSAGYEQTPAETIAAVALRWMTRLARSDEFNSGSQGPFNGGRSAAEAMADAVRDRFQDKGETISAAKATELNRVMAGAFPAYGLRDWF